MFTDLLQPLNEVKTYHKSSGGRVQTIRSGSGIKVVYMKLSNLSRGIRPSSELVHPDAFRARVGRDTTISDLVKTLQRAQRAQNWISFDFGGTSLNAEIHVSAFTNADTAPAPAPAPF